MTTAMYDREMEQLEWGPDNLPDGILIFDTWEQAGDWQRFAEGRLGAALGAVAGGQAPQVEPRFYLLHREAHQ